MLQHLSLVPLAPLVLHEKNKWRKQIYFTRSRNCLIFKFYYFINKITLFHLANTLDCYFSIMLLLDSRLKEILSHSDLTWNTGDRDDAVSGTWKCVINCYGCTRFRSNPANSGSAFTNNCPRILKQKQPANKFYSKM